MKIKFILLLVLLTHSSNAEIIERLGQKYYAVGAKEFLLDKSDQLNDHQVQELESFINEVYEKRQKQYYVSLRKVYEDLNAVYTGNRLDDMMLTIFKIYLNEILDEGKKGYKNYFFVNDEMRPASTPGNFFRLGADPDYWAPTRKVKGPEESEKISLEMFQTLIREPLDTYFNVIGASYSTRRDVIVDELLIQFISVSKTEFSNNATRMLCETFFPYLDHESSRIILAKKCKSWGINPKLHRPKKNTF